MLLVKLCSNPYPSIKELIMGMGNGIEGRGRVRGRGRGKEDRDDPYKVCETVLECQVD